MGAGAGRPASVAGVTDAEALLPRCMWSKAVCSELVEADVQVV